MTAKYYKIKITGIFVNKEKYEQRKAKQEEIGDRSSIVGLDENDCNIYIQILNRENDELIHQMNFGVGHALHKEYEMVVADDTITRISEYVEETRLDKLEKQVKEIQSEIDCIRRGD